jgi:bifunctional DNA-binding transcriptional regulator/antitoxin component of YhaV-PrlF toxin-antitoxin module
MSLSDQAAAVVAASLSKAEKIRQLKRQGMRNADIARALGIRDQFVSNVVLRELRNNSSLAPREEPDRPASETLQAWTQIGEGGRVVIPAVIRAALGVGVGDTVLLRFDRGELRILTPRQAIRRAQELVRQYVPGGRSLADELIAERRAEAARE